jgi:uncharacterized protein YkwD
LAIGKKQWLAIATITWIVQAGMAQAACSPPTFSTAERKPIPTRNINQSVLSKAITKQTNYYRCKRGLPALRHDNSLRKAAGIHARNMARLQRMSHVLPVNGSQTMKQRFSAANVRVKKVRAENIAVEYRLAFGTGVFLIHDAGRCQFTYRASGKPIPQHSYGSLARSVVQRWYDSKGHRANILNRHATRVGSAAWFSTEGSAPCGSYYISQDFAG